jgi:hypothetical protein
MTRIDVTKGTILQGVDLLQLWGNNRLMIGLDGQLRLAPVIDTVTLEFMAAEDNDLLLYEDNDKIKLEGAA